MARLLNSVNAALNTFVKDCLELKPEDRVLEIGFGPGNLINEMASITTAGIVEGIDFSEVMLKQAMKVNAQYISSGRVVLQKGECDSLPYENDMFDKLCSINTLYFLEKPDACFAEMFRVVRPGGQVVIGFRDDEQMSNLNLSKDVFSLFSKRDVVDLLLNAGFQDAQIKEKEDIPFVSYCGVATKA